MTRALAIVGLLALAGPARADEAQDALACVRTKLSEAYVEGWALRSMTSTALGLAEQRGYAVSLVPGRTYRVIGCAAGAVADLDLVLFDAQGRIVKADGTADVQPVLDLSGVTGAHTLVLYGRRASGPGAGGAAFALLHR